MADYLCGYVGSTGSTIVAHDGTVLATVTHTRSVRLTRSSWVHGRSMLSVWATDASGARWYGRGSPAIAIRLRRVHA